MVERMHDLAEDIELQLAVGGVADPHRPGEKIVSMPELKSDSPRTKPRSVPYQGAPLPCWAVPPPGPCGRDEIPWGAHSSVMDSCCEPVRSRPVETLPGVSVHLWRPPRGSSGDQSASSSDRLGLYGRLLIFRFRFDRAQNTCQIGEDGVLAQQAGVLELLHIGEIAQALQAEMH